MKIDTYSKVLENRQPIKTRRIWREIWKPIFAPRGIWKLVSIIVKDKIFLLVKSLLVFINRKSALTENF